MTCLLAVTTLLPIDSAAAISVWAGSSPPISSTMTSISVVGDEVGRRVGQRAPAAGPRPRARLVSRTATATSSKRRAIGRLELVGPVEQRPDDLAADRPRAEHADAQRAPLMTGDGRVATSAEW